MAYRQLTREQRYLIYKLRKAGYRQTAIAKAAGVSPSTISRELRRNVRRRGYRPAMAHRLAMARRARPCRLPVLTPRLRVHVRHGLRKGWSPEQIAGRAKRAGTFSVSAQTIYRYLYADRREGGLLHRLLRRKGVRYRRRPLGNGPIRDRKFIEARPPAVEDRKEIGHWEVDTIVSPDRSAIVTMVERVPQLLVMRKVPASTSLEVAHAMVRKLGPVRDRVLTITSDNGAEFASHGYVARKLKADFYFSRPYKPWQRALNEKTNGLIRHYFPKRSRLGDLTDQQVTAVAQALNTRPRKSLNYLTPNEIFYKNVALGE